MAMLESVKLDAADYAPFLPKEVALLRKGFHLHSYVEDLAQFKEHGHDDPHYLAFRDEHEGPWWKAIKLARDRYGKGTPEYDALEWFVVSGVYPFAEERKAGPEAEMHQVAFYNTAETNWQARPDPVWPGFRAEIPLVEGGLPINWVLSPTKKIDDMRETAVRLFCKVVQHFITEVRFRQAAYAGLSIKAIRQIG